MNEKQKELQQASIDFPVIKHEQEGQLICQRVGDGYVNATAMCKVAGKLFAENMILLNNRKVL